MPEPAVAFFLYNSAFPVRSGARGNITRVDAQPLQHSLARLGELLDRVHNADLIVDSEMVDQGLVGELVNASLVAAQVNGDTVGLLVVECGEQALTCGHGLFAHGSNVAFQMVSGNGNYSL